MKNWIIGIIVLIIIALGVWYFYGMPGSTSNAQTVHYACDNGKTITAVYHDGATQPAAEPGQPPTPTGTADVSLDGGASMALNQTISADGVRYANSDESFVFWNKGSEALVMRDNSMDLDYTNCTAQ